LVHTLDIHVPEEGAGVLEENVNGGMEVFCLYAFQWTIVVNVVFSRGWKLRKELAWWRRM
jgi:hypothetical protein